MCSTLRGLPGPYPVWEVCRVPTQFEKNGWLGIPAWETLPRAIPGNPFLGNPSLIQDGRSGGSFHTVTKPAFPAPNILSKSYGKSKFPSRWTPIFGCLGLTLKVFQVLVGEVCFFFPVFPYFLSNTSMGSKSSIYESILVEPLADSGMTHTPSGPGGWSQLMASMSWNLKWAREFWEVSSIPGSSRISSKEKLIGLPASLAPRAPNDESVTDGLSEPR